MVRILVLKRLYSLSDEQMEYQLLNRISYLRFGGLSDSATIPDRTTIRTIENRIGEAWEEAIFASVERQLRKAGFIARCGQIVDVNLIPAPKQHFNDYKLSIGVDARHKFNRKLKPDTALAPDCQSFETVIDPANMSKATYGDKGYASQGREDKLKDDGYRNHKQRKAQRIGRSKAAEASPRHVQGEARLCRHRPDGRQTDTNPRPGP